MKRQNRQSGDGGNIKWMYVNANKWGDRPPAEELSQAMAYFNQGDYVRSMNESSRMIKLNPEFAPGYCIRGLVHLARNKPIQALSDFNKALRLEPALAGAYNGRGIARCERVDYAGGIEDFSRAIELFPG
jgi:tetratricopeptide (TPR) repeat protein